MPSTPSAFVIVTVLLLAGCQAPAPLTPSPSPTTAPPSIAPSPALNPTQASTSSGTSIRLTPESGPPGTAIQIEGYLPGGPSAADAEGNPSLQHTTVCWDGCLTGFTAVDVPVQWSANEAGRFTIGFSAPSVPWLGPQGPRPVQDGDFAVGVQCLGPLVPGCAAQEAQAAATFRVTGSQPSRCGQGQPCAELTLTPGQAQPGDAVEVSGWAPLIETISGQPFGYTIALQTGGPDSQAVPMGQVTQQVNGELSGSFTVPQTVPGAGVLSPGSYDVELQATTPQTTVVGQGGPTIASASLRLGASVAWGSLSAGSPVWMAPTADLVTPSITVDPADPTRLAYCAPSVIRLSNDSGQSWREVPIAGAVDAVDKIGFEVMSGGATGSTPQCISVALDADHPDSLFAVFGTAERQMGAPPEFFKGLITTDGGANWRIVPSPGPAYDFPFGGFASLPGGQVEALFNTTGDGNSVPQVEATGDGGSNWQLRVMACPSAQPCLRWGPAPGSISGMGAARPQTLLVSANAGHSWSANGITLDLHAGVAGTVAGFDAGRALVVAGQGTFPAQWSSDGGLTWEPLALPTLGGAPDAPGNYPALQILPNGSLIALADTAGWILLPPGASSWCSPAPGTLPGTAVRFAFAAGQIWWLDPGTGEPRHTSLASTTCSP